MKRLLVILTTSPASRCALVESIAFARKSGARVRLVRVVDGYGTAADRASAWLDEMEELVPRGLSDGSVTLFGDAPEAIAREADFYGADGVVIGARTYDALTRMSGVDLSFETSVVPKLVVVHEPRPQPIPPMASRESRVRWQRRRPSFSPSASTH